VRGGRRRHRGRRHLSHRGTVPGRHRRAGDQRGGRRRLHPLLGGRQQRQPERRNVRCVGGRFRRGQHVHDQWKARRNLPPVQRQGGERQPDHGLRLRLDLPQVVRSARRFCERLRPLPDRSGRSRHLYERLVDRHAERLAGPGRVHRPIGVHGNRRAGGPDALSPARRQGGGRGPVPAPEHPRRQVDLRDRRPDVRPRGGRQRDRRGRHQRGRGRWRGRHLRRNRIGGTVQFGWTTPDLLPSGWTGDHTGQLLVDRWPPPPETGRDRCRPRVDVHARVRNVPRHVGGSAARGGHRRP